MTRQASWRLAIVVSAAALSAVAGAHVQQQPARDQPAQRPQFGTGVIAGVVINGETNQPIADATISLVSAEVMAIRVAQSDRAGRFLLPAVPAGRFVLHASKPAYLGAGYGATKAGRPGTVIALADGQQLIGLTLKMWPGAVVTGVVTDEQGEPLPDAEVQLQRIGGGAPDLIQTMMALGGGRQNTTDDRGVFRIYGIAPGEYVVSASPRGGPPPGARRVTPEDLAAGQRALREARPVPPKPSAVTPSTPLPSTVLPSRPVQAQEDAQAFASADGPAPGWAPVYFPGTSDPTRATSITLALGEERTGVNMKVELVPLARVEGTVFGADGAPAANVQVMLQREGAGPPSLAAVFAIAPGSRSGANGRFTVRNAGPGQYTLTARTVRASGGPAGANLWASAPLTVAGQNITGVVLQLQTGMSLSGRVVVNATRVAAPASLAGVTIAVTAPSGTRDPMNALMGLVAMSLGGQGSMQVARENGTFDVTGLAPGSYLVNGVFGRGESPADVLAWRVASVMIDGRDVLDLPIEIKPNGDIKDVVVTFTDAQQELSGVITDAGGQPLTASTVILFATDRRYWYSDSRRVLTARPGTDGRYEFGGPGGPTAGDYFLSVVTDLDPGQQFEPSFLTALAKASPIRVTFGAGEKKTQDLRVGRVDRSSLSPLEREQLAGGHWVEVKTQEFRGAREGRIMAGGQILRRRQDDLIGDDARVLQALAVFHDQVRARDRDAVDDDCLVAQGEEVLARFHDRARRSVADHGATFLELDDAREQLRRRARLAVDEHDELSGVGAAPACFGGEDGLAPARDALADQDVTIEDVAQHAAERVDEPAGIASKVQDERRVFPRDAEELVHFAVRQAEDRHLPDHDAAVFHVPLAPEMVAGFFIEDKVVHVHAVVGAAQVAHLAARRDLGRDGDLALLARWIANRQTHRRLGREHVEVVLHREQALADDLRAVQVRARGRRA